MVSSARISSLLTGLVVLLVLPIEVTSIECGSLVTYRQHAVLLQSAPECLREGCSQGRNNTISSSCPSSSPCSAYWSMFVNQFDQKNAWCDSCGSDTACRIPNWPVMNATALCETSSDQLFFGDQGCCATDDEPFQLARWTRTLCNSSEWQERFSNCGDMACPDWREWIMPWNWTVQNNLLPADQQVCRAPSAYLAIYAGEHFFWLLAAISIGCLRLWIARHEEDKNYRVFRYFIIASWAHITSPRNSNEVIKSKLLADGEHLRPSFTAPLKWGFPVIMGLLLAGAQLGFNFWVAHEMKTAPGYEDLPLATLALLFCCRPRLSWLSCMMALVPRSKLQKWFKFQENGDGLWAAKVVLSSVAVSAAVSEAIMQLLGAYFLGTTARIGHQRKFYIVHNLRPKMWGNNARRMYLGALFWLMVCIPLLIVWIIVATFSAEVYFSIVRFRRGVFDFMRSTEDKVSGRAKPVVEKIREYINPDTPEYDQPYRGYYDPRDQPQRATMGMTQRRFEDQPTHYHGAAGELSEDQPFRSQTTVGGIRSSPLHGSAAQDQPFMVPRRRPHEVSDDIPSSSVAQRRTASGTQYGALSQDDDGDTTVSSTVQHRTPSGRQYGALSQVDEDTIGPFIDQPMASTSSRSGLRHDISLDGTTPSHRDGVDTSLLTTTPLGTTIDAPSTSDVSSSNKRADYKHELALKRQTLQAKVILAGAFLGMLAYAAQWVFWDGFIKASGDRFCPPNYWKVNGIWWGGTVVYVGAPLMAY